MRFKYLFVIILSLLIGAALTFGAVSKGLIGKNDIKLWDGKTSTFTRVSSSGRHLTLNKIDWPGVDVKAVYGNGTNKTDLVLSDAKSSVGSTNKVAFWLSPETWTISNDITISSNITLVCPPGCVLSVASGKTLTIEGPVIAGPYQIFSGDGTVSITIDILEHDQWKDASGDDIYPSVDNAIDLGGSSNEFKDLYVDGTGYIDTLDLNGTAITATGAEINTVADGIDATAAEIDTVCDGATATAAELNLLPHVQEGYVRRPKFAKKDADEIYINSGAYLHEGTTTQIVYWDSQITFHLESTGSNASSSDYGSDDWHYIYLDDSAIVTQAAQLLDADCFLNSTTEPAWSDAKHGWYNGSDRCIFAIYETGSAVVEFYHEGDTVLYGEAKEMYADADPGSTFVDLDLTYGTGTTVAGMPKFSTVGIITALMIYVDGATTGLWRTNGSSENGHTIVYSKLTNHTDVNTVEVITDGSQVIEHRVSGASNTIGWDLVGWELPTGM